ncbi:S-adenosylmethionine decarboxylase [Halospina denitrificans]|uniref:S-adenosylmethionine decarboxylase proenzyme n=1 Tax=Halospina denitrificans TaxID=332522 RepID=A0A4R7JTR6_9GAMM|nr:adenosylmethionine decarboxylase [Halospina denitrificans]TDT40289.1 S-adenosylmethionine decarboxylase [Halospina denitrificans]
MENKLELHGFNNLTKSLCFNIYDICYARTEEQREAYIDYIDEMYNAERLTQILTDVVKIIGANILNIAHQDYDPHGASVTMLIAEHEVVPEGHSSEASPGPLPETLVGHLDKSHVTVHTYPESHPYEGISTFRADIDVSTCGLISPLKALNYLIHSFDSDIVTVDYRIRGFTRDVDGKKHYTDHDMSSIQDYLTEDTRAAYQMMDVNVYQDNLFHTKMILREFNLDNYVFGVNASDLDPQEADDIHQRLQKEMLEIFYSRNLP